jgi:hypothetical protein
MTRFADRGLRGLLYLCVAMELSEFTFIEVLR